MDISDKLVIRYFDSKHRWTLLEYERILHELNYLKHFGKPYTKNKTVVRSITVIAFCPFLLIFSKNNYTTV